jgi:adenylate cyclase
MEHLLKSYSNKLSGLFSNNLIEKSNNFTGGTVKSNLSLSDIKKYDSTYQTDNFLNAPDSTLTALGRFLGIQSSLPHQLGKHPDFIYLLNTRGNENHEIVSVFIDLKGSKNLIAKHGNEIGHYITNVIQTAAIHICTVFGGYIQRLEGDGLFIYFGDKRINRTDSIRNSLLATSILSFFMKNDIKKMFAEDGIERIYTRIGIDFGYHDDILWAINGTRDFNELTTTGLHTSLAKTMQGCGYANSIIVGDNIKENIISHDDFCTVLKDKNGRPDESNRYVFTDPLYAQFDFNWYSFLKRFKLLDADGSNEYIKTVTVSTSNQNLLDKLRTDTNLVKSNLAHTDQSGFLNTNTGVKNLPHSFYYED